MIVNVAQQLKSEVGTTRRYSFDEVVPDFGDDVRLVAPVRGTAELIRTNRGILVRGHFTTSAELECSRCLELAAHDLTIDFSEEYLPVVDVVTGLPTEIPKDNSVFLISDKHELDVGQAVREYGLLELPMQPLCQTDCAGLCPQCGANLNRERCHCVVEAVDGRFAVLRALLTSDNERT